MRFLSDASEQGGELLLYSDEPMDWMAGDRDYFALWASLMVACVKNGVRIKIIHNVDRAGPEIIDAIQGWFPLYISGTIEPYVFTRPRNARFCHTVFLHRGRACIHAFSPTGAADRWYDYLTEKPKLDALEREYETMLSAASPFLKTYPAAMGGDFLRFRMDRKGDQTYLLSGPPVATMPEGLLERMLSRAEISPEVRTRFMGASDFLDSDCERIYYVDTRTDCYLEFYRGSRGVLEIRPGGTDFFRDAPMKLLDGVAEEDAERVRDALQKCRLTPASSGEAETVTTYRCLRGGVLKPCRLVTIPARDDDGHHIVIGVKAD